MMKICAKNLIITSLMVALGFVLPSLFHLIAAGPVMLPMHIPVLITGLVCGPAYGTLCGVLLPILSCILTGMPTLFPTAISMTLELCAYGFLTGLCFQELSWRLYPSMITAMLAGRVASGIANTFLYGMTNQSYSLQMFIGTAFVTALPGITIQLVLIPAIVAALIKAKLIDKPIARSSI